MKKDASRFSPKGVLFHGTFFTAPLKSFSDTFKFIVNRQLHTVCKLEYYTFFFVL